jgi:hypothetical protein
MIENNIVHSLLYLLEGLVVEENFLGDGKSGASKSGRRRCFSIVTVIEDNYQFNISQKHYFHKRAY